MIIEMLPTLMMNIRAAAIANENGSPLAVPGAADGQRAAEPAAPAEPPPGPPLVRALRCRPGMTYATAGNVILPLTFAERMPGWRARSAPRR